MSLCLSKTKKTKNTPKNIEVNVCPPPSPRPLQVLNKLCITILTSNRISQKFSSTSHTVLIYNYTFLLSPVLRNWNPQERWPRHPRLVPVTLTHRAAHVCCKAAAERIFQDWGPRVTNHSAPHCHTGPASGDTGVKPCARALITSSS